MSKTKGGLPTTIPLEAVVRKSEGLQHQQRRISGVQSQGSDCWAPAGECGIDRKGMEAGTTKQLYT